MAYIEDILIFSLSWKAHLVNIRRVIEALRKIGLTVNLKKSKIGQQTVQYLGFCIGQEKIWAIPDKVATVRDFPLPPTKKDLQRFLGLANYYQRFMLRFSS